MTIRKRIKRIMKIRTTMMMTHVQVNHTSAAMSSSLQKKRRKEEKKKEERRKSKKNMMGTNAQVKLYLCCCMLPYHQETQEQEQEQEQDNNKRTDAQVNHTSATLLIVTQRWRRQWIWRSGRTKESYPNQKKRCHVSHRALRERETAWIEFENRWRWLSRSSIERTETKTMKRES